MKLRKTLFLAILYSLLGAIFIPLKILAHTPYKSNNHSHDNHTHNNHSHDNHTHNNHSHNNHTHNNHSHDNHTHNNHSHDNHTHNNHSHDNHTHNNHSHDNHRKNAVADREQIDYWTNYFFKLVRPEMRYKKVRAHHTIYRRELTEIRKVVANIIDRSCHQPHLNNYYLLTEREREENHTPKTQIRRRFIPRGRGLSPYYKNQLALRDRYDDWDRAYYYESELSWKDQPRATSYSWERSNDYFFNGLYQDLTNAIFHARHPDLSRDVSIENNLNWATEWTFIRQYFASYEEEDFLKQYFIPFCEGENY